MGPIVPEMSHYSFVNIAQRQCRTSTLKIRRHMSRITLLPSDSHVLEYLVPRYWFHRCNTTQHTQRSGGTAVQLSGNWIIGLG